MNPDPLDLSRDAAVDAMIDDARSKALIESSARSACAVSTAIPFEKLNQSLQAFWRRVAKAVLDEARKAGYFA